MEERPEVPWPANGSIRAGGPKHVRKLTGSGPARLVRSRPLHQDPEESPQVGFALAKSFKDPDHCASTPKNHSGWIRICFRQCSPGNPLCWGAG